MEIGNKSKYNNGHNAGRSALYVARVAVMAGTLTALKFALSFIPNVEVITLLILVYASAFGIIYVLPATVVFCIVETAIYGLGSWVVLYFIYWPLLAVVGGIFLHRKRLWLAVVIAVAGSILFGVLSACSDTVFIIGYVELPDLGRYWVAYYVRGLYFDLVHVVSSAVTVAALYLPLRRVSEKLINQGQFSSRE